MIRIAIVSPSPMLAEGLAAALAGVEGWQVELHATAAPAGAAPDLLVLHGRACDEPAPPGLPLVLIGDDLREAGQRAGGVALALLAEDATPAQLRAAVEAVLQGLSVRDPAHAGPAPALAPGTHEPLTPRELEVFELIGKGLSNPDIAGVLGISAHTAKFHVGQILAKVGAATRAEAVRAGLQMGLIGL
ncbi:MAG: response regulator transcription factor [Burkholderiales bacterium]|nr:response regulator transcription factor [Burkholderiales bacterium]